MAEIKYNKHIVTILVISTFIIVWIFATHGQSIKADLIFPRPVLLLETLANQYIQIIEYSLTTWYRVVVGLCIGSITGLVVAILMSYNKLFYFIFDPIIEIIRPIPPIALVPFFILWLGLGSLSQMLLISLGCFMIVTVSCYVGFTNVPPVYLKAAQSLGASKIQLYRTVYIPAIIPGLIAGIRVALASSFALTVAAEYLGAQGGLGYLIRNARQVLHTETILLAAIILGIQSLVTDQIIRWIFGKFTKWQSKLLS